MPQKIIGPRGRHIPAHEQELLRGALPADFDISEVEQERTAPDVMALLVEFNGPQMVHDQPSRSGAPFSQVVNAAGDTILGSDPRRKRAVIVSSDFPFYYSANPQPNPSTASACLWPANTPLILLNADEIWCAAAPPNAATGAAPAVYATANFAAAAAGNVSLPAGDSITGFDVSFAAAAAPVSGTITVSGLTGANLVYNVAVSASSDNLYEIRFPQPLPAGTTVNVAVSAIVGGSAGTIVVYGLGVGSVSAPAATIATLGVAVEVYAD
jgi:hypothetical protein